MIVANSFDLWQKDAFFSAAEEVQESADILESSYRGWLSAKRLGASPDVLCDLQRELRTALGTAKWQLEEFEKAVLSSYRTCGDENRMARHQQFVLAMESQISHVKNSLNEMLHEEGKQPLKWVNLDEEEKDDLAMFLSGSPEKSMRSSKSGSFSYSMSSEGGKIPEIKEADSEFSASRSDKQTEYQTRTRSSRDETAIAIDVDTSHNAEDVPLAVDDQTCQGDRTVSTRRTLNFPNYGALQVVIPYDNTLATSVEATPKAKGYRMSGCIPFTAVGWINQVSLRLRLIWMNVQSPRHISPFIRLTLAVVLIFFLFVVLS